LFFCNIQLASFGLHDHDLVGPLQPKHKIVVFALDEVKKKSFMYFILSILGLFSISFMFYGINVLYLGSRVYGGTIYG
jgi:hypothetical protein